MTLRIGLGTAEVLLAPHNQEGGHRALEVAKGGEGFPHFFMLFYFIFVLFVAMSTWMIVRIMLQRVSFSKRVISVLTCCFTHFC